MRDVCLLIVPAQATFNGIKNVALASILNVEEITPVGYLKAVLDFFKPQLHIVM
jgi:hypothetical protein